MPGRRRAEGCRRKRQPALRRVFREIDQLSHTDTWAELRALAEERAAESDALATTRRRGGETVVGPPEGVPPGGTITRLPWRGALRFGGVDWGDVPAWVGSVPVGVGALLAAVNFWRSVREKRQDAASKVWALCERYHYGDDPGECEAVLRNDSDEPAFEGTVRLLNWDWASNRQVVKSPVFPTVLPRSSSEVVALGPIEPRPDHEWRRLPPLELEFTDGHGRRWCRAPDGRLRRANRRGLQC